MSIRIFRHYVQLPIILLMLLEAGIAVLALYATAGTAMQMRHAIPSWVGYTLFASVLVLSSAAT